MGGVSGHTCPLEVLELYETFGLHIIVWLGTRFSHYTPLKRGDGCPTLWVHCPPGVLYIYAKGAGVVLFVFIKVLVAGRIRFYFNYEGWIPESL